MQTKVKKTYNILLRIIILLTTYGFLYIKVFYGKDWHAQYLMFLSLLDKPGVKSLLLIVVLLMLVNWSIESGKWRFLIKKIERVTFLHSLQAVFAGLSISFFTPNRTGEYVGRAFILDKASHVEGILITILGSMSQLFITILAGTLALLVFIPEYMINSRIFPDTLFFGVAVLIILLDLLLFFLLINVQFLSVLRDKLLRSKVQKIPEALHCFCRIQAKGDDRSDGSEPFEIYRFYRTVPFIIEDLFSAGSIIRWNSDQFTHISRSVNSSYCHNY